MSNKDKKIKEEENLTDIQKATSKVLAAQVVAYRLVPSSASKKLAIECMTELSKRREIGGSTFDYEKYIEDKTNIDLPEPVDLEKITSVFQAAKFSR